MLSVVDASHIDIVDTPCASTRNGRSLKDRNRRAHVFEANGRGQSSPARTHDGNVHVKPLERLICRSTLPPEPTKFFQASQNFLMGVSEIR